MLIFLIGIGIIGIGTPRSFFLYKAIEYHADFVIHCEGIALDTEVTVGLQGAEVQAQRAVVLTGNSDVLAHEHARVALREPGHHSHGAPGYGCQFPKDENRETEVSGFRFFFRPPRLVPLNT